MSERFCPDCEESTVFDPNDPVCSVCGAELVFPTSTTAETSNPSTSSLNLNFIESVEGAFTTIFQQFFMQNADAFHSSSKRPASVELIARLEKKVVGARDPWFCQPKLQIPRIFSGEVLIATAARFGPQLPELLHGTLAFADPLTCTSKIVNAEALHGKIVFAERGGGISFSEKVKRLEECKARAVIVGQTHNIWPYTMTDSSGNGSGIQIPSIMIRKAHAEKLKHFLETQKEGKEQAESCSVELVYKREEFVECPICQETLIGETALRLPCLHIFHDTCICEWLKITNTCPLCRFELKTEESTDDFGRQQRQSRERNVQLEDLYK